MRKLQFGLSLIELMIVLALSTLFMLGITRYSLDSVETDRMAFALSENQDSVRIAMDLIRHDIMMGGFKGCSNSAVNVGGDELALLTTGVEETGKNGNELKTARLVPLFNPNPNISIDENDLITLSRADGKVFGDINEGQLVLANCNSYQVIKSPKVAHGAEEFALETPVSPKFYNRAKGETMPSTRLYSYRVTHYQYSPNILENDDESDDGDEHPHPSLFTGESQVLITGLAQEGWAIQSNASGTRFSIALSMGSQFQKDSEDKDQEPRIYKSNITALNRRMTQ